MTCTENDVRSYPTTEFQKARFQKDPLGDTQALVLKALSELKDEACGYCAIAWIESQANVHVDHSQVYKAVRSLRASGLIAFRHMAKGEETRGPSRRIYLVTDVGHKRLEETLLHHVALIGLLS